jgi:hypothetical protein
MTKKTTPSPWAIDETLTGPQTSAPGAIEPPKAESNPTTKTKTKAPAVETPSEPLYDFEGLMTDFPTAKDLEKFVFDQTGIVLNLKGRSNKFKYQTAMDVLNGREPEAYLLGSENPYLDKNDLIPIDDLKKLPARPAEVQGEQCVASFISKTFQHPDTEWAAQGQKCEVVFRKYINNVITYEIIGPISTRAVGVRVNKFGKEVPEKYTWVDPRTGEQVIRKENGSYTPVGTRLRAKMQAAKINKSDYWSVWIDREFVISDGTNAIDNPWGSQL